MSGITFHLDWQNGKQSQKKKCEVVKKNSESDTYTLTLCIYLYKCTHLLLHILQHGNLRDILRARSRFETARTLL